MVDGDVSVAESSENSSLKRSVPTLDDDENEIETPKRTRGRTGCLNCRKRRKKCDEVKPTCTKCQTRGEKCKWDTGVTFRWSGIDAEHPSMQQARTRRHSNQTEFRIVDVTFKQNQANKQPQNDTNDGSVQNPDGGQNKSQAPASRVAVTTGHAAPTDAKSSQLHSVGNTSSNLQRPSTFLLNNASRPDNSRFTSLYSPTIGGSPTSPSSLLLQDQSDRPSQHLLSPHILSLDKTHKISNNHHSNQPTRLEPLEIPAIASASSTTLYSPKSTLHEKTLINPPIEMDSLDYLTCPPTLSNLVPTSLNKLDITTKHQDGIHQFMSSPYSENSTTGESHDDYAQYYPNAAYKELHTTLHQHMVETAQHTNKLQQGSHHGSSKLSAAAFGGFGSNKKSVLSVQAKRPLNCTKLSKRRQLELWRNYLEEIAIWLDMFDNERHFQYSIPVMAKAADHLQYSILALSARQLERKNPDQPYTESLGLYQDAIKLIVRDLQSLDTTVITSCVLLCVLEMMSSSPRAWGKHLDGCAMLLEAAGINGVVGGVKQALFWCFARMDVWGGFLGDTLTKIPTNRWFLSGSMSNAVSRLKSPSGGYSYANYAVFLCASVVNVISNRGTTTDVINQKTTTHEDRPQSSPQSSQDSEQSYTARWKALYELLEDWYDSRPEEMQPLMSYPSILDDQRHPFPMVLYSTSPAVNGNQLYHASSILLLQEKPREPSLTPPMSLKSIIWHARQICGIAAENHHHGPWINALQPLWIAGKVMNHAQEHQAILDILTRIEKETGWATQWRAHDLIDYWSSKKEGNTKKDRT